MPKLVRGAWPFLCSSLIAVSILASCTPPPPPAPPPSYVPPTVTPPPEKESERKSDRLTPRVVEIDPQGAASRVPQTLVEAAEAEQQRRRRGLAEPALVITNENLSQLGEGIELTYVEDEDLISPELAAVDEREDSEAYWRDRIYQARLGWREAVDLQVELEERAALLRRRFYSEDDPFVRDGQIKPEWDRVLDRMRETEQDILRHREEVDTLLAEGQQADAEPGWLDAGLDLEPETDLLDADSSDGELPAHEVKDPPTNDGSER